MQQIRVATVAGPAHSRSSKIAAPYGAEKCRADQVGAAASAAPTRIKGHWPKPCRGCSLGHELGVSSSRRARADGRLHGQAHEVGSRI
jgi:hypothetical protein